MGMCTEELFCSVELTGAFSPTDIGIWEPHTHYGSSGAFSTCARTLSARCSRTSPNVLDALQATKRSQLPVATPPSPVVDGLYLANPFSFCTKPPQSPQRSCTTNCSAGIDIAAIAATFEFCAEFTMRCDSSLLNLNC